MRLRFACTSSGPPPFAAIDYIAFSDYFFTIIFKPNLDATSISLAKTGPHERNLPTSITEDIDARRSAMEALAHCTVK